MDLDRIVAMPEGLERERALAEFASRSWRWPWVSRSALDMAIVRAEAAEKALETARKDMALQIANAYQQATRAIDTAHGLVQECNHAIAEARGLMKESVEMSKTALKSMFGPIGEDAQLPPATTVADADRVVSRRRREEAAGTKP